MRFPVISVGGRVVGIGGGLPNTNVTLSGGNLIVPRTTRTNTFGNFRFDDVEVGHVCIITVRNKKYGFGQDSQVISPVDSVRDIVFQAAREN